MNMRIHEDHEDIEDKNENKKNDGIDANNAVFNIETLTLEERLKAILLSHRALIKIAVMTSFVSLMLTILTVVVFFSSHPKTDYFATTTDGKIFKLSPLSSPIESDGAVEGFAGRALTDTFTFDYVNVKHQISSLGDSYTPDAFTKIKQDLGKSGGIANEAVQNKWIVTATLMAAPELIHKGLLPKSSTYGWRMRYPLMITYQTEEKTSSQRYYADVTVIRVAQKNNPRGIAIANLQLTMME